MTVTVFLLMVFTGFHEGWLTVPNLPDEAACRKLGETIRPSIRWEPTTGFTAMHETGKCIKYEVVVAKETRL